MDDDYRGFVVDSPDTLIYIYICILQKQPTINIQMAHVHRAVRC